MKTKCYSVRLKSLIRISDKAYKAESFDGSTDIIPASQIFGIDSDVKKAMLIGLVHGFSKRKIFNIQIKKRLILMNIK